MAKLSANGDILARLTRFTMDEISGSIETVVAYMSNGKMLKSERFGGRRSNGWKHAGNSGETWRLDVTEAVLAGKWILTEGSFPELDMERAGADDVRGMLERIQPAESRANDGRGFSRQTRREGLRLLDLDDWTPEDVRSAQEIILTHRAQLAEFPQDLMRVLAGYNPTPERDIERFRRESRADKPTAADTYHERMNALVELFREHGAETTRLEIYDLFSLGLYCIREDDDSLIGPRTYAVLAGRLDTEIPRETECALKVSVSVYEGDDEESKLRRFRKFLRGDAERARRHLKRIDREARQMRRRADLIALLMPNHERITPCRAVADEIEERAEAKRAEFASALDEIDQRIARFARERVADLQPMADLKLRYVLKEDYSSGNRTYFTDRACMILRSAAPAKRIEKIPAADEKIRAHDLADGWKRYTNAESTDAVFVGWLESGWKNGPKRLAVAVDENRYVFFDADRVRALSSLTKFDGVRLSGLESNLPHLILTRKGEAVAVLMAVRHDLELDQDALLALARDDEEDPQTETTHAQPEAAQGEIAMNINRKEWLRACRTFSPLITKRNTIPALQYVRTETVGDDLVMTGMTGDLVATIECRVRVEHTGAEFLELLPFQAIYRFLRKSRADVVTLRKHEDSVEIVAEVVERLDTRVKLDYFPETFPRIESPEHHATVDGANARQVFTRVSHCISREDSRFQLDGALIKVAADGIEYCATDGARLGVVRGAAESSGEFERLVPKALCSTVAKRTRKGCAVHVRANDEFIEFETDDYRIIARELKDEFPADYRRVLDKEGRYRAVVDRDDLVDGAKTCVALLKDCDTKHVGIEFQESGLHFFGRDQETGSVVDLIIDARTDEVGAGTVVGINPEFVMQAAEGFPKGSRLVLRFRDAGASILFDLEDPEADEVLEHCEVVMPVRLGDWKDVAAMRDACTFDDHDATIERAHLVETLQALKPLTNHRSPIERDRAVRLRRRDGFVEVCVNTKSSAVVRMIPAGLETVHDLDVAVSLHRLLKTVQAMNAESIQLRALGGGLYIRGESTGFVSEETAPEEIEIPERATDTHARIEAARLAESFGALKSYIAPVEKKFQCRGGLMSFTADRLECATTDGHRLGVVGCAASTSRPFSAVIPTEVWKLIAGSAPQIGEAAVTSIGTTSGFGATSFEWDGMRILAKNEPPNFPEGYRGMFALPEGGCRFTVSRLDVLDAAATSSAFLKESGDGDLTLLEARGESLRLFAWNGRKRTNQDADVALTGFNGDEAAIVGVNAHYLAETLSAMSGDEAVFHMKDKSSPIIVNAEDPGLLSEHKVVIMPVRHAETDVLRMRRARPAPIEETVVALHSSLASVPPSPVVSADTLAPAASFVRKDLEQPRTGNLLHEKDEDCTVDPETLTCIECGAYHGGPKCPECKGLGFHRPGCGHDRPRIEIGLDPNQFIRTRR